MDAKIEITSYVSGIVTLVLLIYAKKVQKLKRSREFRLCLIAFYSVIFFKNVYVAGTVFAAAVFLDFYENIDEIKL